MTLAEERTDTFSCQMSEHLNISAGRFDNLDNCFASFAIAGKFQMFRTDAVDHRLTIFRGQFGGNG